MQGELAWRNGTLYVTNFSFNPQNKVGKRACDHVQRLQRIRETNKSHDWLNIVREVK
jgi:hypothetical protein